ncbi:MAG TPA: AI-2E family transporter [Ramlibacter sp.]|nr:AI-2E family transporter [Ramlibacter sp.]
MEERRDKDAPAADRDDAVPAAPRVPVNMRSAALGLLTVLAVLATLRWASAFFIPLMLGFMFSYALSPIVDVLQRWRIPRAISAAVLIVGILGGLGASVYSFSDDANQLIESLPAAARKLRDSMRPAGKAETPLETVQKAAAQLEQAAQAASPASPAGRGVQRVTIEKARFDIRDYLWTGTVGLASLIGQITVVTFLTYFLLLSGDTFRRKLVKISGSTLSSKKITVQALDEITAQIQRYLLVQLLASVVVGVTTGLAFWALGLKHAAVWGFAAGVLNLIPYVGSVLVTGAAALVAFLQFGQINMALTVAGISLAIHTVEGNLMVPWLTSKASRMNPVAVFIGVLAWGWLWGVWGLLLGVPILMIVKAVCDRVDNLKPLGELLGS